MFKAVDLFCGAGGLTAGLKNAGIDVKVGVDIDEKAISTYKNNFLDINTINKDICEVSSYEIATLAEINKGDNFLLAGCPPCQGFSNIGKRNEDDEKNKLIFEYIRIIRDLEPSFILMENVPGLSRGIGKKVFKKAIDKLEEKYFVQYDTLNAADFGVPQIRKRLVLHGIRKDVYEKLLKLLDKNILRILPEGTYSEKEDGNKKWKTVGDTILDLPEIEPGQLYDKSKIHNHISRKISEKNIKRLEEIRANGGSRKGLSRELQLECHKKKNISYTDTYGIMKSDRPSPTITSGCTIISKGRFAHPIQNRGLSVREAARLQSFDDSFVFYGNIGDMSLQIGNAVPPKLAEASAKEIIYYMKIYQDFLDNKIV